MAVTLRDVAREVGLNPSTVSRAIAGLPGVSAEKRELVLRTAARLHYQPNALARGLRSGRQKLVGLVFPDVLNELYSSAATVLATKLARHGYLTQLSLTYDHKETEREALLSLAEHQVSGIIIAPCADRDLAVTRMLGRVPVIEFMRSTAARTDKVLWGDEDAAHAATMHLLELGHRDIRFITGVPDVMTTAARVAGFTRALGQMGIPSSRARVAYGRTVADWEQAAQHLVNESPRCTAVIASNHIIALHALAALSRAGLMVPVEMSVIGLDDPSWFWCAGPGITGVHMPWNDMASTAGELLLRRITSRRASLTLQRFPARLIVRGSTAPPRRTSLSTKVGRDGDSDTSRVSAETELPTRR